MRGAATALVWDGVPVGSDDDRCLWLSPSAVSPDSPPTSSQRFAATLADGYEIAVVGLQVWSGGLADPYDMTTEISAVRGAAADRGWRRYHLFGFSAGATVALATARADPGAVQTLALLEPATIGDDDWDPVEAEWRRQLCRVRSLPVEQRQPAFRDLLMGASRSAPSGLAAPPMWDARTDKLEDLLAQVGFTSSDLAIITAPVLVISGALSNPRFIRVAERLLDVLPAATSVTFDGCSHLAPPHRAAPDQLEQELTRLWGTR